MFARKIQVEVLEPHGPRPGGVDRPRQANDLDPGVGDRHRHGGAQPRGGDPEGRPRRWLLGSVEQQGESIGLAAREGGVRHQSTPLAVGGCPGRP